MMLFGSSKPEPTRISLKLPDQLVDVRSRTKRRRASSSSRAAYTFDTDAEADAHDAALRAFFAPAAEAKGEDHVPTMALWALASIGRAYPELMLGADKEKEEEFAAQAYGYYTALHVALYTRRPETFYARRHFIRGASERLAEVLEAQGGGDNVRKWLLPRPSR